MEKIKIEQFLVLDYGWGDDCGYGDGTGHGIGDGCGYGDGCGRGCDDSDARGRGVGSGSGYDDASGRGCGYDTGIKAVGKCLLYRVDGINTVFYSIHKNIARGAIFNSDFTFTPCYIVKGHGHFAHGKTIKQAMGDLERKIFKDLDVEERIDMFVEEFELGKKYPAMKFFDWHNKLTGSCEMGRKSFAKNHDIDLNTDEFTAEEFIKLTENDFGGEVIKQLAERLGL